MLKNNSPNNRVTFIYADFLTILWFLEFLRLCRLFPGKLWESSNLHGNFCCKKFLSLHYFSKTEKFWFVWRLILNWKKIIGEFPLRKTAWLINFQEKIHFYTTSLLKRALEQWRARVHYCRKFSSLWVEGSKKICKLTVLRKLSPEAWRSLSCEWVWNHLFWNVDKSIFWKYLYKSRRLSLLKDYFNAWMHNFGTSRKDWVTFVITSFAHYCKGWALSSLIRK